MREAIHMKRFLALMLICLYAMSLPASGQDTWNFVVSGDSRDCGDVIVPAIAVGAKAHHAEFYWHLGDFRHITDFDADMLHNPQFKHLSIEAYLKNAWPDFIAQQIAPFGTLPVFLTIGNHEVCMGRTRADVVTQFADWLDCPMLKAQRLKDDPEDRLVKTYYQWIWRGVAFINLDNGTFDEFDSAQMAWFENVLKKDADNPSVKTIVVGMHAALPESLSKAHSMNQSIDETESGRRVYADLLNVQAHKHVYVLASHLHVFMSNVYNTEYWRAHGGVLPGWIIGTAGAARFPLPPDAPQADEALEKVYGYLVATVKPTGEIAFVFKRIEERDVPPDVVRRFGADFVHWAFEENLAPSFLKARAK